MMTMMTLDTMDPSFIFIFNFYFGQVALFINVPVS